MVHSSCATMRFVTCQPLQVSKYCPSANSQWARNRIRNVPRSIAATRLPGVRIWERGGLRAPLLPKPEMVFPLMLGEKLPLKLVVCSLPVQAAASNVQIASAIFTFGTVFVLPVYTAMIFAPKWKWTKKIVESDLPFIVMSAMYIYLFALSWTPETAGFMFASKYLLPELPGITRMFSSTIAVASAWIHLLAVDLFCGRSVFLDGLQHEVETRHSLVLCLMMCPVGLISHFVTKAIVCFSRRFDGGDSTTDMGKVLAQVRRLFGRYLHARGAHLPNGCMHVMQDLASKSPKYVRSLSMSILIQAFLFLLSTLNSQWKSVLLAVPVKVTAKWIRDSKR